MGRGVEYFAVGEVVACLSGEVNGDVFFLSCDVCEWWYGVLRCWCNVCVVCLLFVLCVGGCTK